jgi:putative MATE family efflux protein
VGSFLFPCFFPQWDYNDFEHHRKKAFAVRKVNSLDMTQGPIIKKLLLFAMPVLLSSLLQHLYTIVGNMVVGNFALNGTMAQAAIGATNHATKMLLNLFLGVSLGANVVCARLRGARDLPQLRKSMHTAMLLSGVLGVALMLLGLVLSRLLLGMMKTPADVFPYALTYIRVIFLGMPATLVYNFGSAIMRSYGDTKRSMYILGVTGLINVLLNLLLVAVLQLDATGVALATIITQYLSAAAVLWILFSPNQQYQLRWQELHLDGRLCKNIIAVGVPCGINGILQSTSNVILQSTVNTFGKEVIAGTAAAADISCFAYLVNDAFAAACLSFSAQCCGAKAYKRLDKLAVTAAICDSVIVLSMASLITLFARPLLHLFNPDPAVVDAGMFRLLLLSWTTVFFGISECLVGCVRGMGKSVTPTVINMFFLCGIRVLWAMFVFPLLPNTPEYLFLCYPASWVLALAAQAIGYIYNRRRLV